MTKPRPRKKTPVYMRVHGCEISFSQRGKFCEVSTKREGQVPLGIIVSIFPTNLKITKHAVLSRELNAIRVLAHKCGGPQLVKVSRIQAHSRALNTSPRPPPEFPAPPPGGLRADLPARAAAHRQPLSSEISRHKGALCTPPSPGCCFSSTYLKTHIHIQATDFLKKADEFCK